MSESEKISMVKTLSKETNDGTVSAYLAIAGAKICRRVFPFDSEISEVPAQYVHMQVEIAVYLLNKRGAEGESSHTESGVSRTYENGDVPESMLRGIVPMVGVL